MATSKTLASLHVESKILVRASRQRGRREQLCKRHLHKSPGTTTSC
jgi:hypothetical protein